MPEKPSLIVAENQLTAVWEEAEKAETYKIFYSTAEDGEKTEFASGVEDTYCFITDLENNTPYYVWIKSVNTIGESSLSPSASATPIPASAAPNDVSGLALKSGLGQIEVSWDAALEAISYYVYYNNANDTETAIKKDEPLKALSYAITGLESNTEYLYGYRQKTVRA